MYKRQNQWSSPYSYSIDESTEKENRYSISSVYENSDGVSVGWSNPDNFNLSEGQHKLKIRLTDMRSANLYDKFYQQLDTIVPVSYTHLDVYKRQEYSLCES